MPPIALLWLLLLSAPFAPLAPGAQGPDVRALQAELVRLDLKPGPVDGVYGPATAAAVGRLSAGAGLPQDGKADAALLGYIVGKVAAAAPLLRPGDTGAAVTDLQGLLTADGFAVPTVGRFGPATEAAVRGLQSARGLTVDGIVGPNTWSALFERSYTVQAGQSIDGIAATYGVAPADLIAENGGKTLILAGQALDLAYAGVPAAAQGSAPAQGETVPAAPPVSSSAGSQAPKSQGKPAGGDKLIPGRTLAQWGGAGTPQLGVIVLAQDQATALALGKALPPGMVLALPTDLYSLAAGPSAVLATAQLADVIRTGTHAVLWQGSLPAKTLSELVARHVTVLVASQSSPAAALRSASGGSLLAVPVDSHDMAQLATLAKGLAAAGYQLRSPLP